LNLETYQLKTNREQQWSGIENVLKDHGATRKQIRAQRDCFFDGKGCHAFGLNGQFCLHHNPTFEGWQRLLDDEIEEPISDVQFCTLNEFMAGNLSSEFFCIEDQDYYFKVTFGDAFDPERRFPLRINREAEHRVIPLTANDLFKALIRPFARWLRGRGTGEEGLLRFNTGYFESLLPRVDVTPFTANELPRHGESPGFREPYLVQHAIYSVIRFGFSDGEKERVELAQKVTDIMMAHTTELNELEAMCERVKTESQSS